MTSSLMPSRLRSSLLVAGALIASLLLADAASAAQYTIQLHNGSEIGTLRQPREASWDRTMVMVLTETGSWMAIPQEDIKLVVFEVERRRLGQVIDEKTVFLGLSFNDAPTEEEEEAERERSSRDPLERLMEAQERAQSQESDNTVRQFVQPGQAGGAGFSASGFTQSSASFTSYTSSGDDGGS